MKVSAPGAEEDRYFRLADLVVYSTLSLRTLRRYLDDPDHPLPVHRIGGRVLIKRSEFDAWLTAREQCEPAAKNAAFDARVAAAVKSIRGGR